MDDDDEDKITRLITLIQMKGKVPNMLLTRFEENIAALKDQDVINKKFLLHLAVEHGKLSYIKKLLGMGIDVNSVNEEGRTVLDFSSDTTATGEGREEIVKILLDAGGIFSRKPNTDVVEIWKEWFILQKRGFMLVKKKLLLAKISVNFNIPQDIGSIISGFLDTDNSLRRSLEKAVDEDYKDIFAGDSRVHKKRGEQMTTLAANFVQQSQQQTEELAQARQAGKDATRDANTRRGG